MCKCYTLWPLTKPLRVLQAVSFSQLYWLAMVSFPLRRNHALFLAILLFVFFATVHHQFGAFPISVKSGLSEFESHPISEPPSQQQPSQPTQQQANTFQITTTVPRHLHVHGFSLLDNVYLRNGTFFILTSKRSSFPPTRNLISVPLESGQDDLEPTDDVSGFRDSGVKCAGRFL